jgi:hypothetical protein
MVGMSRDPNLRGMDARAYIVATLFGFTGGLLVPRTGPDRKAVIVALALAAAIGVVVWLISDDPYAGPSLTVGGVSGIVGILVRRPGPSTNEPRI